MNTETPAAEKNKGGRPRKGVDTTSAEFIEAVAKATEAATARLLEKLAAQRSDFGAPAPQGPQGVDDGDMSLVRKLALAIGEISDQGTNRKRIAPDILAKREVSRKLLEDLVVRAHVQGLKPEYQVMSETYLEEQLIRPFRTDPNTKKVEPTVIYWNGLPSPALAPLNDIAVEIFNAYQGWIGGMTVMQKTHDGRQFIGDSRPMSVTPGGLVIKGDLHNRRTVGNLADSNTATVIGDRLSYANPHDPTAKEVRVLGTIAPAAKQNNYGEQGR